MPTIKFTKRNIGVAERFLRRGVITPGLLSKVRAGSTVEVTFRGGGTFTQVQQITVDGRQVGGVQPVTKPEGPRPISAPRTQQLQPGFQTRIVTPRPATSIVDSESRPTNLKREAPSISTDGTRSISKSDDIRLNSFRNLGMVPVSQKKAERSYIQRFFGEAKELVLSPVKGFVKAQQVSFQTPQSAFGITRTEKDIANIPINKLLGIKKVPTTATGFVKDPDIQAFAFTAAAGGVAASSKIGQVLVSGLSAKFALYEIGKPGKITPERAARATIFGAAPLLETVPTIRSTAIKAVGKEFVSAEKVFDVPTLRGETTFPMTRSVRESVKRFKRAQGEVAHTTAQKFRTEIGAGARESQAAAGLFVTPKGEASPFFLRLSERTAEPKLGLFGTSFARPQVIEVKTRGVARIPKETLFSGKKATLEFQKLMGEKQVGKAFITPASEARFDPVLRKRLKIATTGEIEALIPVGTRIEPASKSLRRRVFGFEKYTTVKGEAVPIKEFSIIGEGKRGTALTPKRITGITKRQTEISRLIREPTRRRVGVARTFPTPIRRATRKPIPSRLMPRLTTRPPKRTPLRPASRPPARTTTRAATNRVITRVIRGSTTRRTPGTTRTTTITRRGGTQRRILFPVTRQIRMAKKDIFPLKLPKEEEDEELKRIFKFKPSVVAVVKNIKGKKPKRLTGLEIRPIPL